MAFTVSTGDLLERLQKAAEARLDDGWVAEPRAARLALLVREELGRWTAATYPGSTLEQAALDPDSRRRLSLVIHSAPVTHRVEIWGLECGDAREAAVPDGEHAAHSWVVLVHLGAPCERFEAHAQKLSSIGLKRIEIRETPSLSLALWMGAAAPDGCPACRQGR